MSFSILHLNIERDKHLKSLTQLLKDKKPDIVCLAEAMEKDVISIASSLGYELSFAPLLKLKKDDDQTDQEGSAILSKYKIIKTQKSRYDDKTSEDLPVLKVEELSLKSKERPAGRFLYQNTLLISTIQLNSKQNINICTTHFPVTDHSTPGHKDHELLSLQNIIDIEHSSLYLERLIRLIRSLKNPLIFTADLNNPRGEYFYDSLAHELIDQVPISVKSSLDPVLHRAKDIKLMVDTIMTSPDLIVESFEAIEGVSDHKAFLASFSL